VQRTKNNIPKLRHHFQARRVRALTVAKVYLLVVYWSNVALQTRNLSRRAGSQNLTR
jgi:hypothetical protein